MDTCNICDAARDPDGETGVVRSNIRRFADESFELWRCGGCQSLHAAQEVDLDHYYAGYPLFSAELDWKLRVTYANLIKRLETAGLRTDMRILDYGCSGGVFVQALQQAGYTRAVGYDPYAEGFGDPALLEEQYDCIVCQDVIEHVPDPKALVSRFAELIAPGGLISIGTPDGAVLGLDDPENWVHALHQPYHRHILASSALRAIGQPHGWTEAAYYSTMYNNTLFPLMNPRFALHYVRCHDDVFDLVAEPPRFNSWKMWSPVTLFFALFGYFFDRHTDVMAVFVAPEASP